MRTASGFWPTVSDLVSTGSTRHFSLQGGTTRAQGPAIAGRKKPRAGPAPSPRTGSRVCRTWGPVRASLERGSTDGTRHRWAESQISGLIPLCDDSSVTVCCAIDLGLWHTLNVCRASRSRVSNRGAKACPEKPLLLGVEWI